MSHGYEVHEGYDPIVDLVDTATEQFSLATSPGAFLVDVFPILRHVPSWMPGAGFQKKAQEWKRIIDRMADEPHEFVKKQMVGVLAVPRVAGARLNMCTGRGYKYPELHIRAAAEREAGRRQGI